MKKTVLFRYSLPFVMAFVLFLFIPVTLPITLCIGAITVLLFLGVFKDKKIISFFGLCCYYLLAISQIPSVTFDNFFGIYIQIPLVVVPSILFINQVLRPSAPLTRVGYNKKMWSALLFSLGMLLIVLIAFFVIGYFIGHDSFFSIEATQAQVLLLASLSMLFFLPFLMKPIKNTLEQKEK